MRDGRYIDTVETAEAAIPTDHLDDGRADHLRGSARDPGTPDEVVLEVRNLTRGREVRDVSFRLHRGEILGVAGLVGAGRTEVVRAIFGADQLDSGEILVHGKPVEIRGPTDAVRLGIAYLSEDRKRYGLALGMDVETNIVLASLRSSWRRSAGSTRRRRGRSRSSAWRSSGSRRRASRQRVAQPVRRHPAEGGHRQVADRRHRDPDLRRADPRHRRRAPRARSTTCSTSWPPTASRSS